MRVRTRRVRHHAARPDTVPFTSRRRRGAVAGFAALALVLGGCASSAGGDGAGAQAAAELRADGDGELTIYNSYKIAGLDPVGTGTNWLFDWGISENLLQVTDEGEIEPWLAQQVDRDGDLRWVITVREDVAFQNGKPVDAEAIAASLTRQIAESDAAQVYFDPETTVTVEDGAVVITTPEPNAMVPAALAARDNALQIYDVDVMTEADGDSAKIAGAGAFTGPYAIDAWTPENLELSPHVDHWEGTPPLTAVTVRVVADEQARISGVRSGEADLAFYPSTAVNLELAGEPDMHVRASELALQSLLIELNLKEGVFTDRDVRAAFLSAIDYDGVADQVGNGQFAAADGLYPDTMPYAVANQVHDLDEANRLLDDAGWERGSDGVRSKDGQKLTVRFVTQAQGPETADVAVAVKEQVAAAGFDLKIDNAEDSAAVKADPSGWEASVALSGSLSGTADPIQPYLVRWTTDGSANLQGLSNPRLDEIGEELRGEFDPQRRDELLAEAQDIIVVQEAAVVAGTYKYFTVVTGPEWADYEVSSVRRHLTSSTGR